MSEYLLFPTLIWTGKRDVSEQEKINWFESYLNNCDETGKTMDYLGYQNFHQMPIFEDVYNDIIKEVKKYLDCLNVDHSKLDLNITKSWLNVKRETGNPEHDHSENHISFTYYPHIHPELMKDLTFFSPHQIHPNEPYYAFLDDNITEWNKVNCRSFTIPVSEGQINVFPANIGHSTQGTLLGNEPFFSIPSLRNSRFCVGGDILITNKSMKGYDKMLPPISNWKCFS